MRMLDMVEEFITPAILAFPTPPSASTRLEVGIVSAAGEVFTAWALLNVKTRLLLATWIFLMNMISIKIRRTIAMEKLHQ
jgi:hypothetical protein